MKPRDLTSLQDIAAQIHIILAYIERHSHETFENDALCQDAVIRRLEIIGEATTRLSEEFRQQHPEVNWRMIRDMRNFLVHVYDAVDITIVWETTQDDLTPVLEAVEKMLAE